MFTDGANKICNHLCFVIMSFITRQLCEKVNMSATNRTINSGFFFYKLARAVGNAGCRLATALVATISAVSFFLSFFPPFFFSIAT